MSAPTTPDIVTLRLPRDVAREHLRAPEALISEADDAASFLDVTNYKHVVTDVRKAIADAQQLRDALHAAMYCEVTP
mgnify:FL=1